MWVKPGLYSACQCLGGKERPRLDFHIHATYSGNWTVELDKLYPDPTFKALRAVIRKGRENYMCLLNFEDAIAQSQGLDRVTLG